MLTERRVRVNPTRDQPIASDLTYHEFGICDTEVGFFHAEMSHVSKQIYLKPSGTLVVPG